jgi:hypothetical protein
MSDKSTKIKLSDGDLGDEVIIVRCNLAEASAPVEIDYGVGEGFEPTQYQCADARHYTSGLIEIGKRLAAASVEVYVDDFTCEVNDI